MKPDSLLIRGRKAIAYELGCSERTVSKLVADRKIPAKHGFSGGPTSPLIVERKALEALKNGRGG